MRFLGLATQFVEAGHAPHIGGDTPVLSSNSAAAITSRRMVPLPNNCTRGFFALPLPLGAFAELIQALKDACLGALGHRRMRCSSRSSPSGNRTRLPVPGTCGACRPARSPPARKQRSGRSYAVRDQCGLHMAVAVLVLQAFAVQRGAAGGAADQETARAHVAGRARPDRRCAGSRTSSNRCRTGSCEHVVHVRRCPPPSTTHMAPASLLMPSSRIWPSLVLPERKRPGRRSSGLVQLPHRGIDRQPAEPSRRSTGRRWAPRPTRWGTTT